MSVLHFPDGTHRLAPAYDVAMHTHRPHAETRVAMDVDSARGIEDVKAERLQTEATAWGMPGRLAARVVGETMERLAAAFDGLEQRAHSGVGETAWTAVGGRGARILFTA